MPDDGEKQPKTYHYERDYFGCISTCGACCTILDRTNSGAREEITNRSILQAMITFLGILFWSGIIGIVITLILWIFFLWLFTYDDEQQQDAEMVDATLYDEEDYRL